jgi:hypothetical protein
VAVKMQRPTLNEPVEAGDLQLEAVELLHQIHLTRLHLRARHLQRDDVLLGLLLDLLGTVLQATASPINPVVEVNLNLLELVQHETNTRIHRVIGLGATCVVERVGLHRTNRI